MNLSTLSPTQLDTLKEVSNVGMGHAASALSQMLSTPIDVRVPRIALVEIGDIPEVVGGAEAEVAGIRLAMNGPVQGTLLLVFPGDSARRLLGRLLAGRGGESLDELAVSALKEVGNILASAYLVALGGLLGLPLLPSVPQLAWDMAGAVLDEILCELGAAGEQALLIETEFHGEVPLSEVVRGHFLILPDPATLQVILSGAAGVRKA